MWVKLQMISAVRTKTFNWSSKQMVPRLNRGNGFAGGNCLSQSQYSLSDKRLEKERKNMTQYNLKISQCNSKIWLTSCLFANSHTEVCWKNGSRVLWCCCQTNGLAADRKIARNYSYVLLDFENYTSFYEYPFSDFDSYSNVSLKLNTVTRFLRVCPFLTLWTTRIILYFNSFPMSVHLCLWECKQTLTQIPWLVFQESIYCRKWTSLSKQTTATPTELMGVVSKNTSCRPSNSENRPWLQLLIIIIKAGRWCNRQQASH